MDNLLIIQIKKDDLPSDMENGIYNNLFLHPLLIQTKQFAPASFNVKEFINYYSE